MTLGPFLIQHTRFNDDFFIKIGEENEIQLTDPGEIGDAHQFYIKRVNEYSKYFEIISKDNKRLHITATVDWRGYSVYVPKLRSDANGRSYMAIYDRKSRSKDPQPEDPSKCGEDEEEAFFISCYTKPTHSKDASYLIINQKVKWPWSDTDANPYWVGCTPSIKHNSRDGEPMLFKFKKPEEESPEPTPPPQGRVQDDGDSIGEADAGSIHIESVAELHA